MNNEIVELDKRVTLLESKLESLMNIMEEIKELLQKHNDK